VFCFSIDNIFRFTQAGSECPAPAGARRAPWLTAERLLRDGQFAERITRRRRFHHPLSSRCPVPADDLTAQRPATTFAPLEATTCWHVRESPSLGIFRPCIRFPRNSRALTPEHCRAGTLTDVGPAACIACCKRCYKDLQDIIAILAWTNCPPERPDDGIPRAQIQKFMSQPFTVSQVFTVAKAKTVTRRRNGDGFKEILEGNTTDVPEG